MSCIGPTAARAALAAVGMLASAGCVPPASHSAASPAASSASADPNARLPARLRRLSNAEYEATLSALLGMSVELPSSFPEDVRWGGFTANARQGVDPTYLAEAQAFARALAARAVRERKAEMFGCSPASSACEGDRLLDFARQAYRRPLAPAESHGLLALYREASAASGRESALELMVATLLVAPQLLYVSEIGAPTAAGRVKLSSEEAASVLAYMLTGGPPDAELLAAGAAGKLADPAERGKQALRLLAESRTRFQFRRFVREWLGLDALASLTKPVADDEKLRLGLLAETDAFVDEVLMYEGASLDRLLLADFTVIPASLRAFQGLPEAAPGSKAYGRVPLAGSGRVGLLQQPSFLAVHSHEAETAPVLRGKAILERFLCVELPRPSELGLLVNFPLPDPSLTTRQRHARHADDPVCRSCHRTIDALGYPFENFDFVGRRRELEHQRPIDTRVEYDGPGGPRVFEDSRDISRWLAESPRAHECFARQAFRFFTGQIDPAVEAAFLAQRAELPEEKQSDLFELLVAFVQSPLFMERRVMEEGS